MKNTQANQSPINKKYVISNLNVKQIGASVNKGHNNDQVQGLLSHSKLTD